MAVSYTHLTYVTGGAVVKTAEKLRAQILEEMCIRDRSLSLQGLPDLPFYESLHDMR